MPTLSDKEYKKQWYLKNKERILEMRRLSYQEDPDKYKSRYVSYRQSESGKESRKRASIKYSASTLGKEAVQRYQSKPEVLAARAKRQKTREALKRNSAVLMDDEWNDFFIEQIYSLSKIREIETGIKFNVDHIVPLKGKSVCGLHVWYNLRLISQDENFIKHNKLPEDQYLLRRS